MCTCVFVYFVVEFCVNPFKVLNVWHFQNNSQLLNLSIYKLWGQSLLWEMCNESIKMLSCLLLNMVRDLQGKLWRNCKYIKLHQIITHIIMCFFPGSIAFSCHLLICFELHMACFIFVICKMQHASQCPAETGCWCEMRCFCHYSKYLYWVNVIINQLKLTSVCHILSWNGFLRLQ